MSSLLAQCTRQLLQDVLFMQLDTRGEGAYTPQCNKLLDRHVNHNFIRDLDLSALNGHDEWWQIG